MASEVIRLTIEEGEPATASGTIVTLTEDDVVTVEKVEFHRQNGDPVVKRVELKIERTGV